MRPFIHQVQFHRPQGERIQVWASINDSTMKEVKSLAMFNKVKHRLRKSTPLSQLLQVVNGVIIQSEARWKGEVEME